MSDVHINKQNLKGVPRARVTRTTSGTSASNVGTVRLIRRRRRRLPPGQRLIWYCLFAWAIILVQSLKLAPDAPNQTLADTLLPPTEETLDDIPFLLTSRLEELSKELAADSKLPKITAGVFAIDPKTGRFAEFNGYQSFPAASIIKLPILIALLNAEEKKLVDPKQVLVIRKDLIVGGSGILQWRPAGSKISVQEAAELMITHSDNTATNLIIDKLGGVGKFNPLFAKWGLTETKLNNWLPDLAGMNKTSPYELTYLLAKVEQGEIINAGSRSWMESVMTRVRTKTLLPVGLGPGARIAHKTGDIGLMVGDAGIVWPAKGDSYFVAIQVARPHNDRRANMLIRQLSRKIYEGFTGDVLKPIRCGRTKVG